MNARTQQEPARWHDMLDAHLYARFNRGFRTTWSLFDMRYHTMRVDGSPLTPEEIAFIEGFMHGLDAKQ